MADGSGETITAPGTTSTAPVISTSPVETFTGSVPTAPATTTQVPASFIDSAPAEYREKPWFQDIAKSQNAQEALWKGYANAQEVIGKKSTGVEIPGSDATPEQVAAFHKAIGVPEAADKYEYAAPDVSQKPENVQKLWAAVKDDNFTVAMKAEAFKAGLTPAQFKTLSTAVDNYKLSMVEQRAGNAEKFAQEQQAKQTEVFKSIYGDNTDKVLQTAKDTLAKVLPENVLKANDPQLALAELGRYIYENVFKNDTIGSNSTPAAGSEPQTAGSLEAQMMEMRGKKGVNGKRILDNPWDPQYQDHLKACNEMAVKVTNAKKGLT